MARYFRILGLVAICAFLYPIVALFYIGLADLEPADIIGYLENPSDELFRAFWFVTLYPLLIVSIIFCHEVWLVLRSDGEVTDPALRRKQLIKFLLRLGRSPEEVEERYTDLERAYEYDFVECGQRRAKFIYTVSVFWIFLEKVLELIPFVRRSKKLLSRLDGGGPDAA